MVQTVGSAGESLAAGAIFTIPALFMWATENDAVGTPSFWEIAIICLCGVLLGVLFMIPLRTALIVEEHGVLPFPEGTACAEGLLAGEEGGDKSKVVFSGLGIAALYKFVADGLCLFPSEIAWNIKPLKTGFGLDVLPALGGVGYICGIKISSYMFAGGVLGWFVLIPLISVFGIDNIIAPVTDKAISALDPSTIWSNYIRYIGAGAVAAGGIISLVKSLPLIISTFGDAMKGLKGSSMEGEGAAERTALDMNMKVVLGAIVLIILAIALFPDIPVSFLGAFLVAVFGFFFSAVSSRMVGLVGGSNNPVSGMAIATLLFATMVLKSTGDTGAHGMTGAIAIGSIICIIAAMSGDTSQDLKTGYILGATPRRQQLGELVGAAVSAVTIGGVMLLLDTAWGFGSPELSAPQATLMKMIVEGVMDGNLPWTLVWIGVFTAIVIEIFGIPVLPVAIGLYLPLRLSVPIMAGGLVRYVMARRAAGAATDSEAGSGILFCSGMIAGEGLVGILLAVLAVVGVADAVDFSGSFDTGIAGGLAVFALVVLAVAWAAMGRKE